MANTIDPTAASAATASTTASSTTSGPQSLGKDAFLKLLVAQLRYQNPMSPTDPTQFLSQTAQFTEVEKLESIDKQSTDLLTAQKLSYAASLLGHHVTSAGSDGKDITGIVTGMRLASDGPHLNLDGTKDIALSAVQEVTT